MQQVYNESNEKLTMGQDIDASAANWLLERFLSLSNVGNGSYPFLMINNGLMSPSVSKCGIRRLKHTFHIMSSVRVNEPFYISRLL